MIHSDTVFSLCLHFLPFNRSNCAVLNDTGILYPYACGEMHPLFVEQTLILRQENDSETTGNQVHGFSMSPYHRNHSFGDSNG